MENRHDLKYAGFFTRLLVVIVDIFVISLLVSIINMLVSTTDNPILISLIWWLYTATLQSKWQTTVGGKIFGIKVLDTSLSKLSFFKASIRFIVSVAPFLLYMYLRGIQHSMTLPPSPTLQMLPQFIFILLPFVMYASKKRQMLHDILIKSVVIDVNRTTQKDDIMGERSVPIVQKTLRVIGTLLFLMIFGYVAVYTYVFYTLGKHSQNSYDASFHTQYKTDDYNDSKIIFYNKELEKYSEEFMNANEMYEIFETDVKKDLALGCIQYFIRRKNRETWIDEGSNYRKNARNKYANTEEKIKKAKKNSNYMGKHFYTFDLNIVNHVVDEVTKVWSDKNESICEKQLSSYELYEIFIPKYISKFDDQNIHSQFGSKPQQREVDWYELLKEKRHDIFQKIQQEKERVEKDKKRAEEERIERHRKKIEQRRVAEYKAKEDNKKTLLQLQSILFQKNKDFVEIDKLINKVQNIDLWIDGKHQGNLLYQAIKLKDYNACKILLEKGASTTKTGAIFNIALSSETDIKLFKLILDYYLKPENYKNINGVLIGAIHKNSADKKIQIILNTMPEVSKQYKYLIQTAIQSCRSSSLIGLLLSKEKQLNQNVRLFSLSHKNSYNCANKKEIESLFSQKHNQINRVEPKKIKFIRVDKILVNIKSTLQLFV